MVLGVLFACSAELMTCWCRLHFADVQPEFAVFNEQQVLTIAPANNSKQPYQQQQAGQFVCLYASAQQHCSMPEMHVCMLQTPQLHNSTVCAWQPCIQFLLLPLMQADTVVEIVWVDGKGEVHTSARDSPEGRAFCGGLGLIGIMTELVIQMTKSTHTKLTTRYLASDKNLMQDIEQMLKVSEMVPLWYAKRDRTVCSRISE